MKRYLLLLFLFGLMVRVQHVPGPLRWEERDNTPALRDISITPGSFYIPPKAGDHTALSVLIAWPFYRLIPHEAWALRIPSLILGALLGVLLASVLAKVEERAAALLAGLLVAANSFLISWSAYFMQEMSYLFFALLGFSLLESARTRRSLIRTVAAAGCLALSFWAHEFSIIIIPLIGLYLLIQGPGSREWLRSPMPWIGAGFYAICIAPYFVWNLSLRETFARFGGMSLAQQHIVATVLSQRALNARILEFLVTGGLGDLSRNWRFIDLNHVEPVTGALLLGSSLVCLMMSQYRSHRAIRPALVFVWSIIALFSVVDLGFRIYRFSIIIIPACAMAGSILSRLWKTRRMMSRIMVTAIVIYVVLAGMLLQPNSAGAAHEGFRWWRKGPLFSEAGLVRALGDAQERRNASLVVMPGMFWDHVPLRAEYETGVRYLGGSRETIYSSTFWIRPYGEREAADLRVVLSGMEDVGTWWTWLSDTGYTGRIEKVDVEFRGMLEDTTMTCPVFFIECSTTTPPPVDVILERIYKD